MILFGQISFYAGLFLSILGVVAGFGFMFADIDNWAKFFFVLVPLGFVFLFTGLATGLLFGPRDSEKS